MKDVLISIKPQHVENILLGVKTIELRRKNMNLTPGTRLWIYSTLPTAKVEAVAIVETVISGSPKFIWDNFREAICITRGEYRSYVSGSKEVSAVRIKNVKEISPAPCLDFLRSEVSDFHPPQFLKRLSNDNPLLMILEPLLQQSACYV